MPMTAHPVVYVDTETTSLHPETGEIWEVSLIEADGAEHHWFLPVDLADADPFSLQIGGFHDRHPQGHARPFTAGTGSVTELRGLDRQLRRATPETTVYGVDSSVFGNWPGDWMADQHFFARGFGRLVHGKHLVGAVPSFDAVRLGKLLAKVGEMREPFHYHLIDAETLAVGWLAGLSPDSVMIPPWDSDDLYKALGLVQDKADQHTALGDARFVKRVYEHVMGPAGG